MSGSKPRIDGSILKYFNTYRRYIKASAIYKAKTLLSDFVKCKVVNKVLSTNHKLYYTKPMSVFFYANLAFLLCSVTVFVMCLFARAHVVSASKALETLDWEQTAALTGDMATVKKSIQKLNNRLNGMEAKDPYTVLENLRAQANTGQAIQQTQVKRQGG